MNLEEAVCSPSNRFVGFTQMDQFDSRREQLPLQRKKKVEEVVVLDKEDFLKMENFISSQNYTIDKLCLLVLKKEGKLEEIKNIWRKEREERRRLETIVQNMQENIAPQANYSLALQQENRPLQSQTTLLKMLSPREKAQNERETTCYLQNQPGIMPEVSFKKEKEEIGNQLMTQAQNAEREKEIQRYQSSHKGAMELKTTGFDENFMINLGEEGYFDDDEEDQEEQESSEEYKVLQALAGLGNWKESESRGNSYIEQLKRASREYREAIQKMLEIGVRMNDRVEEKRNHQENERREEKRRQCAPRIIKILEGEQIDQSGIKGTALRGQQQKSEQAEANNLEEFTAQEKRKITVHFQATPPIILNYQLIQLKFLRILFFLNTLEEEWCTMWENDRPGLIDETRLIRSLVIWNCLASLDLTERMLTVRLKGVQWSGSLLSQSRGVFKEPLLFLSRRRISWLNRRSQVLSRRFYYYQKMPFSYVANCLFITYGPLAAIYSATGVSQGITHFLGLPMKVLTTFFVSQVLKMVLLATLTPSLSESDSNTWTQEIFQGIAGIADAAGLYYILSTKQKGAIIPISSIAWLWTVFTLITRYFLFFMYNSQSNEHDWNLLAHALTSNIEIIEIMTVAYLVSVLTRQDSSSTGVLVPVIIAVLFIFQAGTISRALASLYCSCSFVTMAVRAVLSSASYFALSRSFQFT